MSLTLTDLPVKVALDKVASIAGGKWERVYRFTKKEAADATPVGPMAASGLTVTLRLADAECATAAAVLARMTEARVESDGKIEGTVTLSGQEMPLEEALDTVARAAGMAWHTVYVIQGKYAPAAKPATVAKPKSSQHSVIEEPGDNEPTGISPTKRVKRNPKKRTERTKQNQLGALGAKAPPPRPQQDLQKLEEMSRLGQFAGLFALEDEADRKQQVKRCIAGMMTQARKLENYQPRQRLMAMRMLGIQLQQYVLDWDALNADQKKEAQPLMDYINQRLKEIETATGQQPGTGVGP
jgi:hypothetical protein